MDFQQCADGSIDDFVKALGEPYYPKWYDLIPCDSQTGWGASPGDWRIQAKSIIASFEECSGVQIGFNRDEVDHLGQMTLADFSEYLIEKAEQGATQVLLAFAQSYQNNLRLEPRRVHFELRRRLQEARAAKPEQ